jgi:hypothetical protein
MSSFFFISLCVVCLPLVSAVSWNLTGEFILTGTGTVSLPMLLATPGSFCFFVDGRAWHKGGESCQLSVGAIDGVNTWTMYKFSGQNDFECGARCVSMNGDVEVSGQTLLIGEGLQQSSLGSLINSFCFLMDGSCWYHDEEICRIEQDTEWVLHKESGQSDLRCGSQCVTIRNESVTVNVSQEITFTGKGDQSAVLPMKVSEGFCFIVHARSWYEGGGKFLISFFFIWFSLFLKNIFQFFLYFFHFISFNSVSLIL